jgi:antitoxin YefM
VLIELLAQPSDNMYNTSVQLQEHPMGSSTYSYLREHLAEVWDEVENSQTPVRIQRRGHQDMALIPADELASLEETAHLLRSPKNAVRLLTALARSNGRKTPAMELAELRRQLGLDEDR